MKTSKRFLKTILISLICFLFSNLLLAQKQFKVLLITETAGWHHESIDYGIMTINELAATHNFEVVRQQNAIKITEEGLRGITNSMEDVCSIRLWAMKFMKTSGF